MEPCIISQLYITKQLECVTKDHLATHTILFKLKMAFTGKMPCKYGPVFAPYLHDWTLYSINTVQKRVRIQVCSKAIYGSF